MPNIIPFHEHIIMAINGWDISLNVFLTEGSQKHEAVHLYQMPSRNDKERFKYWLLLQ